MMARPLPKGAATTAGRPSANVATTRLASPKTSNASSKKRLSSLSPGLSRGKASSAALISTTPVLASGVSSVSRQPKTSCEAAAGDDRARGALLVDPAAAGFGQERPAVADVRDERLDVGPGHHHRVGGDDELVAGRAGRAEVADVEEVDRDVALEEGPVDALERFAEVVDADRLAFAGEGLLAADHVRERIIEDGDLGLRRQAPSGKRSWLAVMMRAIRPPASARSVTLPSSSTRP